MTKIFESFSAFLRRENKDENGVSQSFADQNPNYEDQNETNKGCWNCSDCSGCSDCSRCSDCFGCSRCSDLENSAPAKIENAGFKIPVIENIHQKLLEAIQDNGNKLDMGGWHTCNTTHCRAGRITFLAGEDGLALENKTNTAFAAQQIYHKSSPIKVSPPRFYESNEVAMADIIRCAEEEKALVK